MGDDLPRGIRRTADGGYQTYVWRRDPTKPRGGYQPSKRWPSSASLAEMKAWRTEQELRGKCPALFVASDAAATSFADDAREYLAREKVQHMPTAEERRRHIGEWIAIFGHRRRETIAPHEIQKALDGWRARLSAGSANKRRTALMDLWTVLDGRHRANPVKATTEYAEPDPLPRAPEIAAVLRLLKDLPATTRYGRQCRARLKVLAWTGWPHAIIKQLAPTDLPYWREGRAFVPRRQKGKGARARWLPLLPQAVAALTELHRVQGFGHFSNSSLHKRVTAYCKAQGIPRIRPYDLRHFFGTLIATLTSDERVIMELMLVSTPAIIRRYTEAATNPRVQAAVAGIVRQLPDVLKAAKGQRRRKSAKPLPRKRRSKKTGGKRAA